MGRVVRALKEIEVGKITTFGEVLEAAEGLPLDDQEALAEVLQRRVIERRRRELAAEAREAKQEYHEGRCRSVTTDELMAEILE
jgi:hypothetical protein